MIDFIHLGESARLQCRIFMIQILADFLCRGLGGKKVHSSIIIVRA